MNSANSNRAQMLRAHLPHVELVLDAQERAFFGADRCRGGWEIDALAVAFPKSYEEVTQIVRACAEMQLSIVPSGGRTGLAGGAAATRGELVLSLDKLNKILEVDTKAGTVRCQAGATVAALQQAAMKVGRYYPVDWAATGSAHVAGSIATNAGGIRVLRYGLTRDWVRGLKVVLASGELLELRGDVVKDNTGYDLRQLFIGSEGTLGVIVEATMGITEPPAGTLVALCALESEEALLRVLARLRASDLQLSAFECFDGACVSSVMEHRKQEGRGPFEKPAAQHALIEVESRGSSAEALDALMDELALCLADAQDEGEIEDALLASSDSQARALWAWREDISESLHHHSPHKADVSIPIHRLAEFVQRWKEALAEHLADVPARCFGHVGDGNLHLNLLRPEGWSLEMFLERCHAFDPIVYGLVRDFGGSVSAEHGIGLLKRDALGFRRSSTEIEVMRSVRRALDPSGLFNPGKIFD